MSTHGYIFETINGDNFDMQAWLYPRVVEPLSAGDWIYALAIRTISHPTVPDSLTLACCLVGERLTPWTAETFTYVLNPLREQELTAQEALAVIVQRYFAVEGARRAS